MKPLSRLLMMAALAPALAGCAVADLAAHAVKEYDRPRAAESQPPAAPSEHRPPIQPAAVRASETDAPVTLPVDPLPARDAVKAEPLR